MSRCLPRTNSDTRRSGRGDRKVRNTSNVNIHLDIDVHTKEGTCANKSAAFLTRKHSHAIALNIKEIRVVCRERERERE